MPLHYDVLVDESVPEDGATHVLQTVPAGERWVLLDGSVFLSSGQGLQFALVDLAAGVSVFWWPNEGGAAVTGTYAFGPRKIVVPAGWSIRGLASPVAGAARIAYLCGYRFTNV